MFEEAVARLTQVNASIGKDELVKFVADSRDHVLPRFQPLFSEAALPALTAESFWEFLLFKNNRHWTGLHRQGGRICHNMPILKQALIQMHDVSRPIEQRFDVALRDVDHLGKGILTAVLQVMYPDQYGVWNQTSEAGLKELQVWPTLERGLSPGQRYRRINDVLHQLKDGAGIDLWRLDALFWGLSRGVETDAALDLERDIPDAVETLPEGVQLFAFERHLEQFLTSNWRATDLGREWDIHVEDGDEVGIQYACPPVGIIDILARHKNRRDWLVIELKRGQSGDDTVGQLLRYISYVRHHLAATNERVYGLIIASSIDAKLHYAVSDIPNIAVHSYKVHFALAIAESGGNALPFRPRTLSDIQQT
jgi:hypothetical protein